MGRSLIGCLQLLFCLVVLHYSRASTWRPLSSTTSKSILISVKFQNIAVQCDTYCCNCNGDHAECTGENRKLTYLPRVPANIRHFRMWKAIYHNLTRQMLANISNFNIVTLNLAQNSIVYLDHNAFADFEKLTSLTLSGNHIVIADLKASFKSLYKSPLDRLELSGMKLTSIPEDFFDAFSNRSFNKIELQNNEFSSYNNSAFVKFWVVLNVDMSGNTIDKLNLDVLVSVTSLKLEWNRLDMNADFCLRQSKDKNGTGGEALSAFRNLQSLYLAGNYFQRIPKGLFQGACLPSLLKLDISQAKFLVRMEDNFIADLPKLQTLQIIKATELKSYDKYAFNSSSLVSLTLKSLAPFQSRNTTNMFKYCPQLQSLVITQIRLPFRSEDDARQFLLSLQSIETLNMESNNLGFLPEDTLWRLTKLKTLHFVDNRLNTYSLGRALINVTSIVRLQIQSNGITVVNETTLPWEFRQNVKEINLAQNPFSCTCELLWFRTWLDDVTKNKSVNVTLFPSKQYRCHTPAAMKETLLVNFRPTRESCAVKNPYIVVGIIAGCFLAVTIISGSLSYRYRWYLRFYLYRLKRRRRYDHVKGDGVDGETTPLLPYDAYLAHCNKDIEWIMEELHPLLTDEHGLKVFLEERDTTGGALGDNIPKYMDKSARIILVLSDNYNRDGWRQYEFEHILYAAFEQKKDVIVLLLGDVEAGRMTKVMRRMLTQGSYLQWGSSEEARKNFREGLRVAIKTRNTTMRLLKP